MKYIVKFLFVLSSHIISFIDNLLMSFSDAGYSTETFFFLFDEFVLHFSMKCLGMCQRCQHCTKRR